MKAKLLQMATIRRLTMSFIPNAANTRAEARNPISPDVMSCTPSGVSCTPAHAPELFHDMEFERSASRRCGDALITPWVCSRIVDGSFAHEITYPRLMSDPPSEPFICPNCAA